MTSATVLKEASGRLRPQCGNQGSDETEEKKGGVPFGAGEKREGGGG